MPSPPINAVHSREWSIDIAAAEVAVKQTREFASSQRDEPNIQDTQKRKGDKPSHADEVIFNALFGETAQQLIKLIHASSCRVNLHTRRAGEKGYPLEKKHREVDLEYVAHQFLELKCAGGNKWESLATNWNGNSSLLGFDIDYAEHPAQGSRGCNHPLNDGSEAEDALRTTVWEATGGDTLSATSMYGKGRWLFTVVPEGVSGQALAKFVLEEMKSKGFSIGPGQLEAPMNVARLPLAGYCLDDFKNIPWIDQVGELIGWIREQQDVVRPRRIPNPSTENKKGEVIEKVRTCGEKRPIDLRGIQWTEESRSNGFILACAKKAAENGFDESDADLLKRLMTEHPDWRKHASPSSKRDLDGGWSKRALRWATGKHQPLTDKPKGMSNEERRKAWNEKVMHGIPLALAAGRRGVTSVIAWLVTNMRMSKRILWERNSIIKIGIDLEMQRIEGHGLEPRQEVTPTQSIRRGGETMICRHERAAQALPPSPVADSRILCRQIRPGTGSKWPDSAQPRHATPPVLWVGMGLRALRNKPLKGEKEEGHRLDAIKDNTAKKENELTALRDVTMSTGIRDQLNKKADHLDSVVRSKQQDLLYAEKSLAGFADGNTQGSTACQC